MTVTAPVSASALAELVKLASLPLPQAGSVQPSAARAADQVARAPPPTIDELWQLALTGQQQIAALLPMLERMIRTDPAALQLGHLSRALGDAAHWIDAGAGRLLTVNPVEPAGGAWRQTTRAALHEAADLLVRTEHHLDAITQPTAQANPEILWALSQVVGAQRQVGLTLGTLSATPRPCPAAKPGRRPTIRGATAMLGIALILLLYALAYGMWFAIAGLTGTIISIAFALAWSWRVVVSSHGLRLELRH